MRERKNGSGRKVKEERKTGREGRGREKMTGIIRRENWNREGRKENKERAERMR